MSETRDKTTNGPSGSDRAGSDRAGSDFLARMLELQSSLTGTMLNALGNLPSPATMALETAKLPGWADMAKQAQALWQGLAPDQSQSGASPLAGLVPDLTRMPDLDRWRELVDGWYAALPLGDEATRTALLADSMRLWEGILGQYGIGDGAGRDTPDLPRKDRRFADPRWRDQPIFALIHQSYLLLAEQLVGLADSMGSTVDPERKAQLRFMTGALIEALSPANFPMTNPVVLDRMVETRGESLLAGLEHLLADLRKGKLTHTDEAAFELGRNIAATPGKVVHETPLYQLIQYTPTTDTVLELPLVIFPPWINRFYILDLSPAKSFVQWALDQGLSVFMVSWKSADASMADLTWDDYIRAQIDAVDTVRARLKVPAAHTIGYCVAGTTLAATLAVLAAKDEGHKVASATFFTAQVDFELGGDLKSFIDESQLALLSTLATDGYVDGRYLAATFNLLRGTDLIWNYVVNNYLLGEDYPAFDLLYWNGDATNLPAKWHQAYLRDLYRDNLLVQPGRLSADGVPIDLSRIETPCFIQAGKEDHIAPAPSVWRLTRHLAGPWTFLLAGSGHIAGVVNPPRANKYQYWLNPAQVASYDDFVAGAQETPGSWWPYWIAWIRDHGPATVPAKGKRRPGGRGDKVIEDAPGRYVRER